MSLRDREALAEVQAEVLTLQTLKHKLQVDGPRIMFSICEDLLAVQQKANKGLGLSDVKVSEFERMARDLGTLYDRHCTSGQTQYKAKILREVEKIDREILRLKKDINNLKARISVVSAPPVVSSVSSGVTGSRSPLVLYSQYKTYNAEEKRMYKHLMKLLSA